MQKIVKVIVQKSLHLRRRQSPSDKGAGKPHDPIHTVKSPGQPVAAVKVHSEAYALRPEDIHHMDYMITHIRDGCTLLLRQERNIEIDTDNTADFSKPSQLIVRQVAGMIAQGAGIAMACKKGIIPNLAKVIKPSVRHVRAVHGGPKLPEPANEGSSLLRKPASAACGSAAEAVIIIPRNAENTESRGKGLLCSIFS